MYTNVAALTRRSVALLIALLALAGCAPAGRSADSPPATWAEIYSLAKSEAARLGPDYRLYRFHARPAPKTAIADTGPAEVIITLDIRSTREDPKNPGWYPYETPTLSDRTLQIKDALGEGQTTYTPDSGIEARLSRVSVSPRDVYQLTWQEAHREIDSPQEQLVGTMTLHADPETQSQHGVETVWVVGYANKNEHLRYTIDAQTGKILKKEKI